jgi:hypothetical protein
MTFTVNRQEEPQALLNYYTQFISLGQAPAHSVSFRPHTIIQYLLICSFRFQLKLKHPKALRESALVGTFGERV